MLNNRIRTYVESLLRSGEEIVVSMVGFRPLSRTLALYAVFPAVIGGFALATATGFPTWVGGAIGGGSGAGLAMWLDQRQARADHDGKSLSIGLVVTDQRLWILDLAAGLVAASVAGIHLEAELSAIAEVDAERMQGSGLKRPGAVIRLRDGSVERVIPAKALPFVAALSP